MEQEKKQLQKSRTGAWLIKHEMKWRYGSLGVLAVALTICFATGQVWAGLMNVVLITMTAWVIHERRRDLREDRLDNS